MDKLLNKKEVATALGASVYLVDDLIRDGSLPTVVIRGIRRFKQSDVEALIQSSRKVVKGGSRNV